jgi:hypothetical protein
VVLGFVQIRVRGAVDGAGYLDTGVGKHLLGGGTSNETGTLKEKGFRGIREDLREKWWGGGRVYLGGRHEADSD